MFLSPTSDFPVTANEQFAGTVSKAKRVRMQENQAPL
jgi:hypothetical protein